MRMVVSEPNDKNIYYTRIDQSCHALHSVSEKAVLADVCLLSFFSKHLVLAASHIFESPLASDILPRFPELLESEAVIVDLRDDCRDFRDYVDAKRDQRRDEATWFRSSTDDLARFLDEHVPAVMNWHLEYEMDFLQAAVVESLQDTASPLRRALLTAGERKLNQLLARIEKLPRASRQFLFEISDQILGDESSVLKAQINAAYYVSGAVNKGLHPWLPENSYVSVETGAAVLEQQSNGAVWKQCFMETANRLGLDVALLEECPQLILSLRSTHAKEMRRFRDRWWKLVEDGADRDAPLGDMRELVVCELAREHNLRRKAHAHSVASLGLGVLGVVVGGIGLVPSLGFSVASAGLGLASVAGGVGSLIAGDRRPFFAVTELVRGAAADSEMRRDYR